MGHAKVSTMIRMVRDYLLDNDERAMFDYLVVKQEDFGLRKPFRQSYRQIQAAMGVTRYSQERVSKRFSEMGFVVLTIEYYQNNPYRAFYVDFTALSQPEVLAQIIKPDTETYRDFSDWIGKLAKEQKRTEKPISKAKQRQMEQEAAKAKEKAERIYNKLCNTWRVRIDKYNKGELTKDKPKRAKSYTALSRGRNAIGMLTKLSLIYDEQTIGFSFMAFADEVLRGEVEADNLLLYFLSNNEDGEYKVFNKYLNKFTKEYSHPNE